MEKNVNKKLVKDLNEIKENDKEVYLITYDKYDGSIVSFIDAKKILLDSYMLVIVIGENFILIKKETESAPKIMYIRKS